MSFDALETVDTQDIATLYGLPEIYVTDRDITLRRGSSRRPA